MPSGQNGAPESCATCSLSHLTPQPRRRPYIGAQILASDCLTRVKVAGLMVLFMAFMRRNRMVYTEHL